LRLVWALALTGTGCYSRPRGSSEYVNTPPAVVTPTRQWATKISLPGTPNFYKVSDDLYRGAQPDEKGFRQLEELGIKTVINLRSSHSDRDKLKGTNLNYEHIPMTAWHPENEDVKRFLEIATDANLTPVFVHCKRGADRTGMMCAIYRVAVQGWSKDEAIEEMTKGGYGFYSIWQNIIDYIRKLDIEKIRQQAGIETPIADN